MAGHAGRWWTLGFEAFGDLDSVPTNLTLTVLPEKPVLERIVASGAFVSYPAWLRRVEVSHPLQPSPPRRAHAHYEVMLYCAGSDGPTAK